LSPEVYSVEHHEIRCRGRDFDWQPHSCIHGWYFENTAAYPQKCGNDQENRITGAARYIYTYDEAGNRVEKSNNTTGKLYW